MKRWRSGVVVMLSLLFLVFTALPVGATGPFDGIWFVNQSCPSIGFSRLFVESVSENDAFATFFGTTFNLVSFGLDPIAGNWTVNLGTRIGATVSGQTFDTAGVPFSTFALTATSLITFGGATKNFAGPFAGVQCSLSGTKVF